MEVLAGCHEQRNNVQRQRGDAAPNDGFFMAANLFTCAKGMQGTRKDWRLC